MYQPKADALNVRRRTTGVFRTQPKLGTANATNVMRLFVRCLSVSRFDNKTKICFYNNGRSSLLAQKWKAHTKLIASLVQSTVCECQL